EITRKGFEPALEMQREALRLDPAQIAQHQGYAAIQKGELAQPMLECGKVELSVAEGQRARQKGDLGAGRRTLAIRARRAGRGRAGAAWGRGAEGTPSRKRMNHSAPPRKMRMSSRAERPLTTETPTPCSPPETL